MVNCVDILTCNYYSCYGKYLMIFSIILYTSLIIWLIFGFLRMALKEDLGKFQLGMIVFNIVTAFMFIACVSF